MVGLSTCRIVANSSTFKPSRLLMAIICSAGLRASNLFGPFTSCPEITNAGALLVVDVENAGATAPVPNTNPTPSKAAPEISLAGRPGRRALSAKDLHSSAKKRLACPSGAAVIAYLL
jgi:hypothetical protein